MGQYTVFLFGEAGKGEFCTPYPCRSLPQLVDVLGHPPPESVGLSYAVQALLFGRELIYFRVKEEGFSVADYMRGFRLLENRELFCHLKAIGVPGVGDQEIIEAASAVCQLYRSILITTERDFYDLMTG